jgi:hypothetical protein
MSISNRRAGFDMINKEVASQMVALTLNRPYPFSKYFFKILCDQIDAEPHGRFLMLPRLVMAIINHFIPNLQPQEDIILPTFTSNRIFTVMKNNREHRQMRDPNLFGHLIDPNFGVPMPAAAGGNNAPPPPPPPPPAPQAQA